MHVSYRRSMMRAMNRAQIAAALMNARRLVALLEEMDRVLARLPAEALALLVTPGGDAQSSQLSAGRSTRKIDWHAEVDHLLETGAELGVQEIRRELERRLGRRFVYSTIMSWLRRAVARGEYEHRGRKYRLAS